MFVVYYSSAFASSGISRSCRGPPAHSTQLYISMVVDTSIQPYSFIMIGMSILPRLVTDEHPLPSLVSVAFLGPAELSS